MTEQESSKQAQTEELSKLKEQLETLRKEERDYKMKVDASKAELEKLQKTNLALQGDISQVSGVLASSLYVYGASVWTYIPYSDHVTYRLTHCSNMVICY